MPFQKVADKYDFPKELKAKGTELLKATTYNKTVAPYNDYELVRSLSPSSWSPLIF